MENNLIDDASDAYEIIERPIVVVAPVADKPLPTKPVYEYTPDPDITLENFDILSKKYRPLMWKYIRLVYQMHSKAVEISDLEQEALIALFNSIKNFDAGRKVYFPVYLAKAVLNKLLCYCRNFLPHYYRKDPEREGKFQRVKVYVDTIDDATNPKF